MVQHMSYVASFFPSIFVCLEIFAAHTRHRGLPHEIKRNAGRGEIGRFRVTLILNFLISTRPLSTRTQRGLKTGLPSLFFFPTYFSHFFSFRLQHFYSFHSTFPSDSMETKDAELNRKRKFEILYDFSFS